jgi:phage anti-repressor protein
LATTIRKNMKININPKVSTSSSIKFEKFSVELPKLVFATDYHGFSDYEQVLSTFIKKIKVREIGLSENGKYVAVAHVTKVSKQDISELLRTAKINLTT